MNLDVSVERSARQLITSPALHPFASSAVAAVCGWTGSSEEMDHLWDSFANEAPKTGTTIVACVYDGGVVLGADTRVSTGIYISNRASDKMTALSDSSIMCRSGSAADTEAVAGFVRYHIEQIVMEKDAQPDVKTVAQICNQVPMPAHS